MWYFLPAEYRSSYLGSNLAIQSIVVILMSKRTGTPFQRINNTSYIQIDKIEGLALF